MLFERLVVYETWELLSEVSPNIPIHWIWGGKSERTGGPIARVQTTYRRPENSSNDFFPEIGHMVSSWASNIMKLQCLKSMGLELLQEIPEVLGECKQFTSMEIIKEA